MIPCSSCTTVQVQLYNYKLQKANYYSTVVFIIIVVYTRKHSFRSHAEPLKYALGVVPQKS